MNLTYYFNSLFPKPPTEESVKNRQNKARQLLAVLYSRGNISLQNGRFITSDEIAKRRAAIMRYNF
ncbi:MAG: hypothetical protein QG599_3507 [Pseudomonadota bacterium]|nr:hypothetical protein [Pseudomonadota bacterium]